MACRAKHVRQRTNKQEQQTRITNHESNEENPRRHLAIAVCALAVGACTTHAAKPAAATAPADFETVFRNPPEDARIRTYAWQWINGFITKAGITADLENMAKAGFVGAIIYHGGNVPGAVGERKADEKELEFMRRSGAVAASKCPYTSELGPVPGYMDEAHLAMLRHAADEARRFGLHLAMHTAAGWSGSGGPWIKPKHAEKALEIAELKVKGGEVFRWTKKAYDPEKGEGFIGIVAYRTPAAETAGAKPQLVAGSKEKLLRSPLNLWSLMDPPKKPIPHGPDIPNDATVDASGITDLTALIGADGQLTWTAPAGDWMVLVSSYTACLYNRVVMAMPSGAGMTCDKLDPAALDCHWQNGIKPVLDRLGDHVGRTFRCIFLGKYSPFCGWESSGRDGSSRESCFNQYIASIAHTTGRTLVADESFTSYLSHYGAETPPRELTFNANNAWCDGVNWSWVCAGTLNPYPRLRPGMAFGIWGINYNPNTLSWRVQMPAWNKYMARNQALLQAGRYVADFIVHDPSDLAFTYPLQFPAGYRYDIGIDDILVQLSVRNGKLVLPSGMEYACLMFMSTPDHFNFRRFTPEVLAHVAKLVEAGATVLGDRPLGSWTLKGGAAADQEFDRLVNQLWAGYEAGKKGSRAQGKGKVWWGYAPEEWAAQVGLPPDLGRSNDLMIDFIHRRDDATGADWYLVHSGETGRTIEAKVRFRVTGNIPELWDPVTGEMREAAVWWEKDGVTELPLAFPANGAVYVVFRKPSTGRDPLVAFTAVKPFSGNVESRAIVLKDGKPGVLAFESGRFTGTTKSGKTVAADVTATAPITLEGAWTLNFDPELGGPAEPVVFDKLASWHEHSDPRIKYYSGPVSYTKTIDLPATMLGEGKRLILDLGRVEDLAEVKLNGTPVAVAWCAPMAVDLTAAAKLGANELEIIAVNKWRNRWIGDEQLPPDVDTVLPQFGGHNRAPVKFPDWAKRGEKSPNGRILFSTFMPSRRTTRCKPPASSAR